MYANIIKRRRKPTIFTSGCKATKPTKKTLLISAVGGVWGKVNQDSFKGSLAAPMKIKVGTPLT